MTSHVPSPRRFRLPGAVDVPPPPDPGLQAERTSLAWARMWTATAVAVAALARLAFLLSPWAAGAVALLLVVPVGGLTVFSFRHSQRARWFEHTDRRRGGAGGDRAAGELRRTAGASGADATIHGSASYPPHWIPLAVVTGMAVFLVLVSLVVLLVLALDQLD